MNRGAIKSLIGAITVSAFLFAGCSKSDNNVIAEVGDYEITLQELDDMTRNVNFNFGTADEEFTAKRNVLDSIIHSRLLIQGAYEKNIDKHEEVARVVLANKDKFLLDMLYEKHVSSKVDVTEAEIREFYDNLEYTIHAYQILLRTEDSANLVFEKVKAGENFEQLAYDYSTDATAKRTRGDLGWFEWGATVDEFQRVAFALQPGEVSPPIKSRFGYHIIKLIDKKANANRGEYEQLKPSLREAVLGNKRNTVTYEYFDQIAAKYPVTVDTATSQYVLHKRENLYPPQLLAGLPKSDFDVQQLDRNEKELVLATWNGGQISLFDYLTRAAEIPPQYRPDFDDYDSLEVFIFELKKPDFLAYEASLEGLENEPEFKRKMQLFKDLSMADIMRTDTIPAGLMVTDSASRKYYEEHREEFTEPAKVRVFEILTGDELLAKRLVGDVKSLENFKDKAVDYTERPAQRSTNGDLGYIEEQWFPEIFAEATKLPVGSIGGPVFTTGKYSIFYVADKLPSALKDYLDVKREIVTKLVDDTRNGAISQWIEARKATTKIEVYEDVLREAIDTKKYTVQDTTSTGSNN